MKKGGGRSVTMPLVLGILKKKEVDGAECGNINAYKNCLITLGLAQDT